MFTKEFNGFVGQGNNEFEADVACHFASIYLPLKGTKEEKTIKFSQLPDCWKYQPLLEMGASRRR